MRQQNIFYEKEAFKVFGDIMVSLFCYSSVLWRYQQWTSTEHVQIDFCKRISCLSNNVPNFPALRECGRLPLLVTFLTRFIKYWTKIILMPDARYPKQVYNILRGLDDAGRTTSATRGSVRLLVTLNSLLVCFKIQ